MKHIIILISVIFSCFYFAGSSRANHSGSLIIFGKMLSVPEAYLEVEQGGKSSIIYYLYNAEYSLGDNKVSYVFYSKIDACEFCDFDVLHDDFNVISKFQCGEFSIAEMKTNELHQVDLFILKNSEDVLIIAEDKALFKSWLEELHVESCYQ